MDLSYEKILLSPRSLTEKNIKPEEATLKSIIYLLSLTVSQRSSRQTYILQELTKKIKFFVQLIAENGEFVHRISCERLTYEFMAEGEYVFHINSTGKKFYIIIDGSVSVNIPVQIGDESSLKTIAHLSSGMSFGELALIKDQPRAASIVCDTNCHFAVLSKQDYMNIIGKIEARKLDDFINFLQEIPMFKAWTKKKLEILTYHFNIVCFKRKQIIFQPDTYPNSVYIVKKGEFELMKQVSITNSLGKKEIYMMKIALIGKGEVFCDEEVINKTKTNSMCVCYSTVGELLCISAEDFLMKMQKEDLVREFINKSRSKMKLRQGRLHNFKEFLISHKFSAEVEKESKFITKFQIMPMKSFAKIKPILKDFKPLSAKKIAKIKENALGRRSVLKKYMDIKTLVNSSREESITRENSFRKNNSLYQSTKPMKCHRPGGYFRANLKKSWTGL